MMNAVVSPMLYTWLLDPVSRGQIFPSWHECPACLPYCSCPMAANKRRMKSFRTIPAHPKSLLFQFVAHVHKTRCTISASRFTYASVPISMRAFRLVIFQFAAVMYGKASSAATYDCVQDQTVSHDGTNATACVHALPLVPGTRFYSTRIPLLMDRSN